MHRGFYPPHIPGQPGLNSNAGWLFFNLNRAGFSAVEHHPHDLQKFERFVRLCAGRTGQLLNMNNLTNDAGISHSTARQWVDLLQASYIIFLLPPWFTNTRKRLVKSPKLYFYDVGLTAWLLGIHQAEHIQRDPLYGALFENRIIIDQLKSKYNAAHPVEYYFYRDNTGNEVDLIEPEGHQVHAIEIKDGAIRF